jgi:fatty acid desaturase
MTGDLPAAAASILDRETYRRLVRPRNGVALLHLAARAGFHLSLLALSVHLASTGRTLAALAVLVPHWAAWSFLGWAGLGHELFHRNVLSSRRANTVLFRACSILTWSNDAFFELTHPLHHRHTLGPADVEANAGARIPPVQWPWLLTLDLPGLLRRLRLLVLNATGRIPGDARIQALAPPGSPERRAVRNGARRVLAVQTVMAAVFLAAGQPILIAGVTLAPFCISGFNRVLALLQHAGLEAGSPETRFEVSTRTVRLGPVAAFFYANMNLHLAHHIWPAIPFYNLPEADRELVKRGASLQETRGFLAGLRLLIRLDTAA